MATPEPLTTSDTPFAAYLLYHGHSFQGLVSDKHDRKRKVFVFVKQANSQLLADDYYEGNPQVDPRLFYKHTKKVHSLLRESEVRA